MGDSPINVPRLELDSVIGFNGKSRMHRLSL